MNNIWVQTQEPKTNASKVPLFTLIARIVLIVSLVVSLAIFKGKNFANDRFQSQYYYHLISSYQYALACILVGLLYSAIQTPFAACYALRRKRLINHWGFLLFEFYADKAITCVLGTAVGAAFGVTNDFKNWVDTYDDARKSDFNDFFNINFISSGFLLIGFVSSIALSLFSSRPISING